MAPPATSGAMKLSSRSAWSPARPMSLATPTSPIRGLPSALNRMLLGARPPCSTPAACRSASAPNSGATVVTVSPGLRFPRSPRSWARLPPATRSKTRTNAPSARAMAPCWPTRCSFPILSSTAISCTACARASVTSETGMTFRTRVLSSRIRTATHVNPVASELSSPVSVKPGTSGGTAMAMATPYCLDMATDAPTILATSGGYRDHDRLRFQFADLLHYAVELSGTSGVVPRVCNVGTASGDDPRFQMDMTEAGREAGFNLTHLSLFSMPNLDDIEGHLMAQDVVWVNGGSGRALRQRRPPTTSCSPARRGRHPWHRPLHRRRGRNALPRNRACRSGHRAGRQGGLHRPPRWRPRRGGTTRDAAAGPEISSTLTRRPVSYTHLRAHETDSY